MDEIKVTKNVILNAAAKYQDDSSSVILYHGSGVVVKKPVLSRCRTDTDFGTGFYLTADRDMACRWVSRRKAAVINQYKINLTGLRVCRFDLSEEWLNFITANRGYSGVAYDISAFDVIIGPTANDKLFSTLDQYWEGLISANDAIGRLSAVQLSPQIALKTGRGVDRLEFVKASIMSQKEKDFWSGEVDKERREAMYNISDAIRKEYAKFPRDMSIDFSKMTLSGEDIDFSPRGSERGGRDDR